MFTSDLKHANPSLQDKLKQLYSLNAKRKIDLSFRPPYMQLLQALGEPHKKLPPVIHVAGTNGKGSIVATLRSILEEQGYKVHAYTSPHLCSFNERIYLAGRHIDDASLEDLIDEAFALNHGQDATFFEITTAMAFAAFSRIPADILLLETGMGGRLDCTNVVERPLATIISAIGLDHVEHLGNTREKIAAEKAGIMKRGVPCVVARQADAEIINALHQYAVALGSEMVLADADWVNELKNGHMHFVFKPVVKTVERILPLANLAGLHQIDNTGAALAALEVIRPFLPVNEDAIVKGLRNVTWAARLQDISIAFPNTGWEIWLDGGHNEDAAHVLAVQAVRWHQTDGKDLHLVLGMMAHKNPAAFVSRLEASITSISYVSIIEEPKSMQATDLKQIVRTPDIPVNAFDDFIPALQAIMKNHRPGRILITGSLYLAGHVLKTMGLPPHTGNQERLNNAT
jgi:dihydrofolate synthase / folylpolyglutamate synthase